MKKVTVLGPTRKEGCGVAEYIRQVFNGASNVRLLELTPRNCLTAPFGDIDILHIQFEFFLFDRFVGVTGIGWYLYWWIMGQVLGFKLITTVHSTYNLNRLWVDFPHFHKWPWAFKPGRLFLRSYYWWITRCSSDLVVLTERAQQNMGLYKPKRMHQAPIRGYERRVMFRDHKKLDYKFNFVCFGFAFPNKGFDVAIKAAGRLAKLHEDYRQLKKVPSPLSPFKLWIVSGRTAKAGIPGGGKDAYLEELMKLAVEEGAPVHFTGYLNYDDPLLEELALKATAFIFPYRSRDVPSGALNTVLSLGVPIITSDEKCFDYATFAMKFKSGDAGDLAGKMDAMSWVKIREEFAQRTIIAHKAQLANSMLDQHQKIYASS